MTGEEFLNKVREIKKIKNISWEVKGKDILDPDEVNVIVVADNEVISINYPNPYKNEKGSFHQFASLALIINKLMKQLKNDSAVSAEDDLTCAVNYARERLSE